MYMYGRRYERTGTVVQQTAGGCCSVASVCRAAAQPPAPLVSETKGAGGWAAAFSVLGEVHRVTGVRVVGLTCAIGVNVIRVSHVIDWGTGA